MSFKRQVYIHPVHSEGENRRKRDEIIQEAAKIADRSDQAALLSKTLKPYVVGIVERAFKRYAIAHSASVETMELEWKRFKKILNGML